MLEKANNRTQKALRIEKMTSKMNISVEGLEENVEKTSQE